MVGAELQTVGHGNPSSIINLYPFCSIQTRKGSVGSAGASDVTGGKVSRRECHHEAKRLGAPVSEVAEGTHHIRDQWCDWGVGRPSNSKGEHLSHTPHSTGGPWCPRRRTIWPIQ